MYSLKPDHPSYPASYFADLVNLLVELEQLCMAENWNSRMIEGQLSRKGQLILGIDPDARVVPLYDTMHRSGGVVFTGARHLTTSFLSDAPSTDSAGSSHRPDASYCG